MSNNVLIVFHANAWLRYRREWILRFINTIRDQTEQDFDILELDYGDTQENRLFEESTHHWQPMPTHAHAQNWLIDTAFNNGAEFVFNTNVDDFYGANRIECQLRALRDGYDLVSSNFVTVDENDGMLSVTDFHDKDFKDALRRDSNLLCHPVIAYSRHFWGEGSKYRPEEIKYEDLRLWQREMDRCQYTILVEALCYHRWHPNSVSETTP